jgi:hypothetical protein
VVSGIDAMAALLKTGTIATCALFLAPTDGHAETTTICGQRVEYAITPPAPDVSAEVRGFSGVWEGETGVPTGIAAEATMCIGFVIEGFGPGAKVRAKYVWGDRVKFIATGNGYAIKPGVSAWRGNITGNVMHFDGEYSFELRLTRANQVRGIYSSPLGRGDAVLKRQ